MVKKKMDKFFRGSNTQQYWDAKHNAEGDLGQSHDFSHIETSPLSYNFVAAKFLKENHDGIRRKTLLEIGCSHGYFASYIKEKIIPKWQIEGWDFGTLCIQSAHKQCPNVKFECRDVLLNPVDKDYGIICMFETIEHFDEGDNYNVLDTILEHCEYAIVSTVDTLDACFGEHISHYNIDTFDEKGYDVFWKTKLSPIQMPDGEYNYIFFIIKGKLHESEK